MYIDENILALKALAKVASRAYGEDGGQFTLVIDHIECTIECITHRNSYSFDKLVVTNLLTKVKTEFKL